METNLSLGQCLKKWQNKMKNLNYLHKENKRYVYLLVISHAVIHQNDALN